MKEVKYYEESKNSAGKVCCDDGGNDYSKYRVEDALRTLENARKVLADPKMVGYVKMCLAYKKAQDAEVSAQLDVETKVGKKLKEVFSD